MKSKILSGIMVDLTRLIRVVVINALALVVLNGCGGEGSSSQSNEKIPEHEDKFVTASIVDTHSFQSINEEGLYHVDLLKNVVLSENANARIATVDSLSSDSECRPVSTDESGFTVRSRSSLVCDYSYSIELEPNESGYKLVGDKSSYSKVIISDDPSSVELTPFGVVAYQDETTVIDIASELIKVVDGTDLTAYSLSSDVVLTPSDSLSVVTVDPDKKQIMYEPSSGFLGNEQISYKLEDDSGNLLTGTFVLTVAAESNAGIEIDDGINYGEVEINQEIEIDISRYVDATSDYQLIYAYAFDAFVQLTDATSLDNKSFKFMAPDIGQYFVNVVVTDHRGGYDVSLVKINAVDSAGAGTWDDIVDKLDVFSAPITMSEAVSGNIAVTSSYLDNGVGRYVATFDWRSAESYCNTRGTIPHADELKQIINSSDPSVTPITNGWPLETAYWSQEGVVDLNNGTLSSAGTAAYNVTCINTAGFEIVLSDSNVTHIVADGVDQATVTAQITYRGKPLEGELVTNETEDGTVYFDEDESYTNEDGEAVFTLTSKEAQIKKIVLGYRGVNRSVDVDFVADESTAQLEQITTLDNQLMSGGTNKVQVTMQDYYSNPILNKSVTFSDDSGGNVSISADKTDENGQVSADVKWIGPNLGEDQTVKILSSFTPQGAPANIEDSSSVTFKWKFIPPTWPKLSFGYVSDTLVPAYGWVNFDTFIQYSSGWNKTPITPSRCKVTMGADVLEAYVTKYACRVRVIGSPPSGGAQAIVRAEYDTSNADGKWTISDTAGTIVKPTN